MPAVARGQAVGEPARRRPRSTSAATGGRDTLWMHVPGAMVVTVGTVWLAVWSFTPAARR